MFDFSISDIICVLICFIHLVFQWIDHFVMNKKVDKICKSCGAPLSQDEEHNCELSQAQIQALAVFISSLKKDD